MLLKIKLVIHPKRKESLYSNVINSEDYNQIAQVLADLKTFHNLPIDKAIRKFQLLKSDWDASLGI